MTDESQKVGWFNRLKQGLKKSSTALTEGISSIFTKKRLDASTLEELEDLLIMSDLGVTVSSRVCARLAKNRFDKTISAEEVQQALAEEIGVIMNKVAIPLTVNKENVPHVILMVGVNGAGKTTTIGKLANQFKNQGKKVMLAAGDTFRAAAIEQLQIWGQRNDVPVISGKIGADAAGLAYDALKQARETNMDILLIDTAGRLQNKSYLMDELKKIIKVIKKFDETAPHDTVLILDATTGQNAVLQTEVFLDLAEITGIIMTKLDGTARGGVLVSCAEKFGLPVHAIGVGENDKFHEDSS